VRSPSDYAGAGFYSGRFRLGFVTIDLKNVPDWDENRGSARDLFRIGL